jgi:hypothetical protein
MTDKKYHVHISERCFLSLEKHMRFLANVNVEAAQNFRNDFKKLMEGLETFPERNIAVRLELSSDILYHRALLGKYYAVLYEIQYDEVYVDLILDLRTNNRLSLL